MALPKIDAYSIFGRCVSGYAFKQPIIALIMAEFKIPRRNLGAPARYDIIKQPKNTARRISTKPEKSANSKRDLAARRFTTPHKTGSRQLLTFADSFMSPNSPRLRQLAKTALSDRVLALWAQTQTDSDAFGGDSEWGACDADQGEKEANAAVAAGSWTCGCA